MHSNLEIVTAERDQAWIDIAELRAKLAERDAVVEHLRAFCRNPHEHEQGVCEKCSGIGSLLYGNTSTWRESVGGSAMTTGVCNKCWGSGSQEKPWPSWRMIAGNDAELRAKLAASQQMHARTAEALNVAQTELMVMQSEVTRLQGFLSAFTPLDSLGRKTKADLMATTQEVAMKRGGK